MNFFWVNIGLSYKEAIKGKFLWAPLHSQKQDENGNIRTTRFSHWDNVGTVSKGDIIFCNHERKIEFVAVAKSDAYLAPQPDTRVFKGWDLQGHKIDVELFPLGPALSIEGYVLDSFSRRYNERSRPRVVNKNGHIFQGYMAAIPINAGVDLLHLAGDLEESIVTSSNESSSSSDVTKASTKATTRQALREARIGQGSFRKALIKLWQDCPISGVSNPDLLIASHVKPWALSSDEEKLDPFNGFLFAAHIDKLFDKGLISFDDGGKIIISPHLSPKDATAMNIHSEIVLPLMPQNRKYLSEHRTVFGL